MSIHYVKAGNSVANQAIGEMQKTADSLINWFSKLKAVSLTCVANSNINAICKVYV